MNELPALSPASLLESAPRERRRVLERVLRELAARRLGVRAGACDPQAALGSLGLDSLAAVELTNDLEAALGVLLPPTTALAGSLAEMAEETAAHLEAGPRWPEHGPAAAAEPEPDGELSHGQQAIWLLHRLAPGSSAYHIGYAARLLAPADAPALRRVLAALAERHAALRTVFPAGAGADADAVRRRVSAGPALVLREEDAGADSPAAVAARVDAEIESPFDLEHGPLARALLLHGAPGGQVLVLTVHHIVADFWSLSVLLEELSCLYAAASRGTIAELPDLPVTYGDHVRWQRQLLAGPEGERLAAYWSEQLGGDLPVLELPLDRPRPARETHAGGAVTTLLDLPVEGLADLARAESATLAAVLLAAFVTLLHRYSGQQDLLVGTPASGRSSHRLEALVGYFVNPLALRASFAGDPDLRQLVRQMRDRLSGALAHAGYPFRLLVERLRLERASGRSPVFQAVLVQLKSRAATAAELPGFALGLPAARLDLGGLPVAPFPRQTRSAPFELTLEAAEWRGRLALRCNFNSELFDAVTARRLLAHLQAVLAVAAAEPDRRASELPLLAAAEVQQLREWNATATAYPRDSSVHELYAEQARRRPETVAVAFTGHELTYGELHRRSNQLARRLRRLGVGPEVVVGLRLERLLEMVTAVLGVLKCGGAYLPLDPSLPPRRLERTLADAAAKLLLAQERRLGELPPSVAESPVFCLDRDWPAVAGESAAELAPGEAGVDPANLAYVMYTSGSTGRPKGVAVTHRAVVRLVRDTNFAVFGPDEVFLQLAPLAFDAATLELWGPLLNGGRLAVFPPRPPELRELGAVLAQHGVTTLWLTAGLFHQMVEDDPRGLSGLRQLLAGGDVLSLPHVERALAALPGTALINGYGPTENTTFACCHRLSAGDRLPARGASGSGSVPIGRPIANGTVQLLDRHGQPVPVGVPGELMIGGDGLARGYLGRPDLTAERFVPDPFGAGRAQPGSRLYRSGDLARHLADGSVEFLGRIDTQVKIRGFRVELGDIEACLAAQPRVEQSVVAAREAAPGDRRLVAYVVPRLGEVPAPPAVHGELERELRAALSGELPAYMVPAAFVFLAALPLTANGKVDRQRLPPPARGETGASAAGGRRFMPPSGPHEELLAGLWQALLGLPRVGADDDFFALGGHSLLGARLVARVRDLFGVELPLQELFESSTLAGLAARLAQLGGQAGAAAAARPPLQPIPAPARSGPLPLAFAQERLWLLDCLDPGSPAYNIALLARFDGRLDGSVLRRGLAALAARHETLRTTFAVSDGQPVQVIAPPATAAPPRLPEIDLRSLAAPARERELGRLADQEVSRPFDLGRGPLLRLGLARLAAAEDALLLNVHHIIADGWSLGVLLSDLAAIYGAVAAGGAAALPPLALQYADFAVWQRRRSDAGMLAPQLAYWRRQLAGAAFVLDLPTDRPRAAFKAGRARSAPAILSAELVARLRQLGLRHGTTLFMTMLAALTVLLGRLSGQRDLLIGSPVAGRQDERLEALVGIFLNSLPLRADLAGEPSFVELLGRLREVCLGAFAHQDVPFEAILADLALPRDVSRTPIFQTFFNMLSFPMPRISMAAAPLREVAWPQPAAKFDLTLYAREAGTELHLELVFDSHLFASERAGEILRQLQVLLEQAADAPEAPIDRYSLLTAAARRILPDPRAPLGAEWLGAIHDRFAEQARLHPRRPALADPDEEWSYGDLDARANRLAHHLLANGVRRGEIVAIYAHRSAALVWGVLGVLKAGAATLLLDPAYPASRLSQVLGLAAPHAWLQLAAAGGPPPPLAAALDRLPLRCRLELRPRREHGADGDPLPAAADPGVTVGPDDLACISFTSGSTGVPKGVLGRHGPLTHFIPWQAQRFGLGADDRFGMLSALSHDPLQRDVFTPLFLGATLLVPPAEIIGEPGKLADWVRRERITVLHLTPAMGQLLTTSSGGEPAQPLPDLRRAFFVGETLSRHLVEALRRLAPGVMCINLYGSTETQRAVGYRVVAGEAAGPTPARERLSLGAGMQDVQLLVLNGAGVPAGIGELGEIYVRSPHLARGYLDDEALTRQRFLPNPATGDAGDRLYRTGDLGRFLPDGDLEFEGRGDHQVKIRGFRVETGEIEHALGRHPGVREAVVVAHVAAGGPRLAAYVVAGPDHQLTVAALRLTVSERLPDYMVPADWVFLDELPLTPNKKIDRRALPVPAPAAPAAVHPPRDPIAELIANIWEQLLERPVGDAESNFFELGGHSLLAAQLLARLRRAFAVELPLRAVFDAPTVAGLAALVAAARGRQGEADAAMPLAPASRDGALPLSFAQQRLWFLEQLDPGSAAYHLPAALRIDGPLAVAALGRALGLAAERHEILRTAFPAVAGEPVQRILPAPAVPRLALVDLAGLAGGRREQEAQRLGADHAVRPFDLAARPAWRAALVRLEERRHLLLLTLHHLLADGWSITVLVGEVGEAYAALVAGRRPSPPPLPIQYADYALAQRRWLQGARLARLLVYWRERLAGELPVLALPLDRPRRPLPRAPGARETVVLPAPLMARLAALSREHDATLYMTLLAAFASLLVRITHQEDVLIGSPIANRPDVRLEGLIGLFANTLVLRLELAGDPTFAEALERARQTAFGAFAHQELPFEKLVEQVSPDRDLSVTPIFQAMLTLQNTPAPPLDLPGLAIGAGDLADRAARFEWTLTLAGAGGALSGSLEYRPDLFDRATVVRTIARFATLLAAVAVSPSARLSELSLLPAGERAQVLREWNDTACAGGEEDCLHQLVAAQAARSPAAAAVADGTRGLTYGELDRAANRLAHHLRRLGVGSEVLVGIAVEPGPDALVSLLAILKAGGAYLPLDPAYPRERLAMMVEDAAAPVVVTQTHLLDRLPTGAARVVCLDRDAAAIAASPVVAPRGGAVAANLAYVLFTSGTTGRPKGVQITHRSLVQFLAAMRRAPGIAPTDVLLAATSLSFDIAVLEQFLPLLVGARVETVDRETAADGERLLRRLRASGATVMQATPSTWRLLLAAGWAGPGPRVLCGGEALPSALAAQLGERAAVVWNLYGPTETTVWSAASRLAAGAAVTLGRPIANTRIQLLGPRLETVPAGVPGEIAIGGAGVARGYRGRPALTAERFVPDPTAGDAGERLYRTGDLARQLADGRLQFLGRNDHQVKIRGFRIECGEIEAALASHPAVRQAVVMALTDRQGGPRLVAWCTPAGDGPPLPAAFGTLGGHAALDEHAVIDELRRHLRRRLPDYMIPAAFVLLAALPLTPNGKLDRRALPKPPAAAPPPVAADAGPIVELLAEIWGEALELPAPAGDADFFALGGHSLLALRIVTRVRAIFGVELPVRALFETPDLAGLARRIEQLRRAGAPPPAMGRASRERPLPASLAQQRLWFLHAFDPAASSVYNLPYALALAGKLDAGALASAVTDLARRHEILRTTFHAADELLQVIAPPRPVRLPQADLRALPAARGEAERARRMREEAARPFALGREPAWRVLLLRLGEREHVLLLTIHHIAADGRSAALLAADLLDAYAAFATRRPSRRPEPALQYGDFAVWERSSLDESALAAELGYWRTRLAGAPRTLNLPLQQPRPARPTFHGIQEPMNLTPAQHEALRRLGREQGTSLFMSVLVAIAVMLHLHTGDEDLLIGAPIDIRDDVAVERTVGLFLNTLVLRVNLAGDPTLRQLLDQVRETVLEAHAHKRLPFARLVEALRPVRGAGETPLFQVACTIQAPPPPPPSPPGIAVQPLPTHSGRVPFDVNLNLVVSASGVEGLLSFRGELFPAAVAAGMAADLRQLLEILPAQPEQRLDEVRRQLGVAGEGRRAQERQGLRQAASRRFDLARRRPAGHRSPLAAVVDEREEPR